MGVAERAYHRFCVRNFAVARKMEPKMELPLEVPALGEARRVAVSELGCSLLDDALNYFRFEIAALHDNRLHAHAHAHARRSREPARSAEATGDC